jgi:hypothetical protein
MLGTVGSGDFKSDGQGYVVSSLALTLMSLHTASPSEISGHFLAGGSFEKFVDECLIGLRLFGSQTAELGEKPRRNADGNQLLGVACHRPADAPRAAELLVGGFRNIGKVQLAIRHMPDVLYALPGAR